MKILFDGYWWPEGPISNREVMREVLLTWLRLYDDELTVLVPHAVRETAADEIRELSGRDIGIVSTRIRPHGLGVLTSLQWHARGTKYDAVFTQNFSVAHTRSGTFVHDVLFRSNPGWFSPAERAYFSLITASIPRASVILTSSSTEATRIGELTKPRDVVAVGLGPRASMLRATAEKPNLPIQPGQYILSVGRFNPRKNLARVAEAATPLVSRELPLVIVGDTIPTEDPTQRQLTEAIRTGSIIAPGFVSDSHLRWLYQNCRVFVMASLGEGFGMPMVEAASFEKPIVASNIAVFREIVSGAFFIDPYRVESIREGIRKALSTRRLTSPKADLSWELVTSNIRTRLLSA